MSRMSIFSLVSFTACATCAMAVAQVAPTSVAQATQKSAARSHPLIKPGDRNCLRSTGSLIPAKPGACLPVNGRSYSSEELRRTGVQSNAHALQMLDPGISLGH